MAQDNTCGTGMTAQAEFPTLWPVAIAAMAQLVRSHTAALDGNGPAGAAESQAWSEIAAHGGDIPRRLRKLAQRMGQCHDLPANEHDMAF